MATSRRYSLMEHVADWQRDHRRWGGTWFEGPPIHAAALPFPLDRHLGVQDLMCFDAAKLEEVRWSRGDEGAFRFSILKRSRGAWNFGWDLALLEMLVDPVLVQWVPSWVVEQHTTWNAGFLGTSTGCSLKMHICVCQTGSCCSV